MKYVIGYLESDKHHWQECINMYGLEKGKNYVRRMKFRIKEIDRAIKILKDDLSERA